MKTSGPRAHVQPIAAQLLAQAADDADLIGLAIERLMRETTTVASEIACRVGWSLAARKAGDLERVACLRAEIDGLLRELPGAAFVARSATPPSVGEILN